jgi:hypothetical protein
MKTLRAVHLYLGCAFAPLLAFYIITGFLQTFDWHESRKDNSYHPPKWAEQAASVHMHQRLRPEDRSKAGTRWPMRFVAGAMCVGAFSTVTLGLMLAWQLAKQRKKAMLALAAGTIIPVAVVWLQVRWR